MSPTLVHLVRHGQVHNPTGILYGRLPGYRLSETGEQMAEAIADFMAAQPERVTRIVTSPLLRARQTAEPTAHRLGLSPVIDTRLIEAANRIEGQRPTVATFLAPQRWPLLRNPFAPSWGESYRAIAARMWSAVDDARAAASGQASMLVSHQLPIWILRCFLAGERLWHDPRRRECALASVTTFEFSRSQLVDIRYDEPAASLAALPVAS